MPYCAPAAYTLPIYNVMTYTSKIAIGDFIENLSRRTNFSDIAVKELPMEEIITKIYKDTLNGGNV